MHNLIYFGLNRAKIFFPKKLVHKSFVLNKIIYKHTAANEKSTSFNELINKRRSEANRSIVVQVSSEKSFSELYSYCSNFGNIIGSHHYKLPNEEIHYILIEYGSEDEATEAINSACYNEDLSGVPVKSPFVWFKAASKRSRPLKSDIKEIQLNITDGTRSYDDTELNNYLRSAQNIEDQILILYNGTRLNDLGIRLRFIAAKQIETSISGMFPFANAWPFGSSVNGFGKMGCDLDLILRFDSEEKQETAKSRFVFHTKENLTNCRSQTQRQMENIGDMLHLFLPGISHVRRILQARVPIIKYHHEHLDLEVDLSMSNLTGVYMSELLYMFGQIDSRVRPLTFCLRRWAQTVGLTNPSPGRWITNFSLTCLVIFFLQQMKEPILPSVNLLCKSARKADVRVTEDGINCSFLRDPSELTFNIRNKSKLSELLLQFFEFYSQFDFNNRGISLNEGRSVTKPDHSPVYIVNPLEQVLNVSKNISLEECERLRIEVRNAAWILESEEETQRTAEDIPWGLLNLFKTSERAIIRPNMFFKPRMVQVSELFNVVDGEQSKIDFKNQSVKNEVHNIKAKSKANLKQLWMEASSTKGRRR